MVSYYIAFSIINILATKIILWAYGIFNFVVGLFWVDSSLLIMLRYRSKLIRVELDVQSWFVNLEYVQGWFEPTIFVRGWFELHYLYLFPFKDNWMCSRWFECNTSISHQVCTSLQIELDQITILLQNIVKFIDC